MLVALICALVAQAPEPLTEPPSPPPSTEPASTQPASTEPASTEPASTSPASAPSPEALKPGRTRKPKPYALTALPLSSTSPELAALSSTLTASWWASLAENGDVRLREGAAPCADDACAARVGGEVVWGTIARDENDPRLIVVDLHLFEADAERSIRRIRLDAPDEDTLRAQLHEAAYLLVDAVPPQHIPATVIAGGAIAGVGLLGALAAGGVLGYSAYTLNDSAASTSTKAQAAELTNPAWVGLAVSGGVFVLGAVLVVGSLP